MQLRPDYSLGKIRHWRLIFRNHWSNSFNENFVFIMGSTWQGYNLKVYQVGLFNFSLCLLIDPRSPFVKK
jgi:hypothetical protein